MAVFRIERTRDYTVMSNHHLRNANLSLKAKGLLSMMLSLPEDWNYTTRGLAKICKEGVDAIGAALRELEAAGYIVRHIRGIFRMETGVYAPAERTDEPPGNPWYRPSRKSYPYRQCPRPDAPASGGGKGPAG